MRTSFGSGSARYVATLLLLNVFGAGCSDSSDDGSDSRERARQTAGGDDEPRTQVSWQSDIAPIVEEKCTRCHQAGGIAPFSMEDYESAKPWASAMADAIEQDRMPPFLAQATDSCQPRLPWYEDLRLSTKQKAMFRAWAKAGAPAGVAKTGEAVRAHAPPPAALEREDVVMRLPEPIVVEGTSDIHTCIVVDPELAKDSYIRGRMITPGNAKVLHHLVSYVIEPGKTPEGAPRDRAQLLATLREVRGVGVGDRYDCFGGARLPGLTTTMLDAWAPGGLPNVAPPDTAQLVDKDALILLDVHYHPTGEPETDSDTRLSLMFADARPSSISQIFLFGNASQERRETPDGISELKKQPGEAEAEFTIPADVKDHVEDMSWTFNLPASAELKVYATGTHMHYVGRDMRVRLEHMNDASADREECLIETPQWDFNWQRGYAYDAKYEELPSIKNGDKLHMHCVYDNTMQNRFVAKALHERGMDAPVEVKLGEDTLDEMCVAAVGVIYPNQN